VTSACEKSMQLEPVQLKQAGKLSPPAGSFVRRAAFSLALALLLPTTVRAQDTDGSSSSEGAGQDDSKDAFLTGTLTLRSTVSGGDGNDRMAAHSSLEWRVRHWSGGLTLNLENTEQDGALWQQSDIGSLDLTERWMGWSWGKQRPMELRLGTSRGVSFAEGLVLGSPTFDGLEFVADATQRVRLHALVGTTEALDPKDLYADEEPFGLFPTDDIEDLGDDGRLAALRVEGFPRENLRIGGSIVGAEATDTPTAELLAADAAWSHGMLDLAGEVARRSDGGTGGFLRATMQPVEAHAVTVELRRYADFYSPLSSVPRYAGLSPSDEHDERGALVRYDFSPWKRVSGSVSTDYSQGGDKTTLGATVRRDYRLALRWSITDRTTLAWGIEAEDVAGGHDGRTASVLATHSFMKWGRLTGRLFVDRATGEPRDSLRVGWRVPLCDRKLTLLVDGRIERAGATRKELELGASWRLDAASSITGRVTLAQDAPESVDVTWYRRF